MECHLVTCRLNLPLLWHLVRCGKAAQKTYVFDMPRFALRAQRRGLPWCHEFTWGILLAVNREFSLSRNTLSLKVVLVIPCPKFEPTNLNWNGNLRETSTPSSERFQASHSKLLCMLANETDPVTNDSPVKKRITHPMNSWHGLEILEGQTEQSQPNVNQDPLGGMWSPLLTPWMDKELWLYERHAAKVQISTGSAIDDFWLKIPGSLRETQAGFDLGLQVRANHLIHQDH